MNGNYDELRLKITTDTNLAIVCEKKTWIMSPLT